MSTPRQRRAVPVDPEAETRRNAQGLRWIGRGLFAAGVAAERRARGVCIVCGEVEAGPPAHTCKGCVRRVGHGVVDAAVAAIFGGKAGQ